MSIELSNGIILPDVPDYDREAFPYVVIFSSSWHGDGMEYIYAPVSSPVIHIPYDIRVYEEWEEERYDILETFNSTRYWEIPCFRIKLEESEWRTGDWSDKVIGGTGFNSEAYSQEYGGELLYSNHDIYTAKELVKDQYDFGIGYYTLTDDIYFYGLESDVSGHLSMSTNLLKCYADQARRLTGVNYKMNGNHIMRKLTLAQTPNEYAAKVIAGSVSGMMSNPNVNKVRSYAFYNYNPDHFKTFSVDFPNCTYIGQNAFYNSTLENASFPKCTYIDINAFYGCGSLKSVYFPVLSSIPNSAFYSTALTYADFPVCTTIGAGAFLSCRSLISANFPSCTNIYASAFAGCTNLTSVSLPVCVRIGTSAFAGCTNLTSVDLPTCEYIGSCAFISRSNLTSVSFPVCTIIGDNAFLQCSSLTSVEFPACTTINAAAFQSCINLTSVNFPICTSISAQAFLGCTSLTSVDFPVCISIKDSAFIRCSNLTSINFPVCNSVGRYAFAYCSNLTDVNLPTCTNTDVSAFAYCSKMSSITLPVCSIISQNAFYYCNGLEYASFPMCSSIGYGAFYSCSKLMAVELAYSGVVSLASIGAFSNTPMSNSTYTGTFGSIYVPFSLVGSYKTATNWSKYSSRIASIEQLNGDILAKINDDVIYFNSEKNISTSFFEPSEIPDITITSSDASIVSVSNISTTLNELTFDLTSYDIE